MTRDERMPWSSIADSFSQGGGIWAAISAIFTAACFAAVGVFKVKSASMIARDADLAERESNLIKHLADEISRLNALVADLDIALKEQANYHRSELEREREDCNVKMTALHTEMQMLHRRMNDEEGH